MVGLVLEYFCVDQAFLEFFVGEDFIWMFYFWLGVVFEVFILFIFRAYLVKVVQEMVYVIYFLFYDGEDVYLKQFKVEYFFGIVKVIYVYWVYQFYEWLIVLLNMLGFGML